MSDCNDCDSECTDVYWRITTDQNPEETVTYFESDDALTLLMNYTIMEEADTTYHYTASICPERCYYFYIGDDDGICCDHGEGSYSLVYQGEVVTSGGDFQNFIHAQVGNTSNC